MREQRVEWSLIAVDHAETSLGASPITEVLDDNSFSYLFTVKMYCSTDDVGKINAIISKPLQFKIIEMIYKGKRRQNKSIVQLLCRHVTVGTRCTINTYAHICHEFFPTTAKTAIRAARN